MYKLNKRPTSDIIKERSKGIYRQFKSARGRNKLMKMVARNEI